jgi:ribosomal protein S18 acetylase RimI-like enzyme
MPDTTFLETPAFGVRTAQREDAAQLIDIMTLAFAADPAARWIWPDPAQYLEYFPKFVQAFGGGAVALGTAFVCADLSAAALWFDPENGPDEDALGAILEESIAAAERDTAFDVFEQMGRHHPDEPHWYLPLIGVEPAKQRRGHGAALMRRALRQCDRDGRPAYLEASSLRSIPFYQAHGFEVTGRITVGACPPIFPMVRPAR